MSLHLADMLVLGHVLPTTIIFSVSHASKERVQCHAKCLTFL